MHGIFLDNAIFGWMVTKLLYLTNSSCVRNVGKLLLLFLAESYQNHFLPQVMGISESCKSRKSGGIPIKSKSWSWLNHNKIELYDTSWSCRNHSKIAIHAESLENPNYCNDWIRTKLSYMRNQDKIQIIVMTELEQNWALRQIMDISELAIYHILL